MSSRTTKKKDDPKTSRGKAKAPWQGYVNWAFDRIDKAKFKEWSQGRNVFDNDLPDLITAGYKVSLSYDEYNKATVGSLYCHDSEDPNGGWCLTARAQDPYEALLRVMFIHYICFEGVWPENPPEDDDAWQ